MKLIEPDTTTHDSIPAKTGENDGDGMKLIEAEKAKDVIHEYFKSLMVKDASGADVYKLAVGIVSCLEHDANLLKAIDELPSIQPEQRWIPVTEIPPRGRGLMLKIYDKHNLFYYYHMGFHDGEKYYTYNFFWWEDKDLEIVGWQLCPWEEGKQDG